MSDIFIVYDQQGNITTAQDTYPQVTPPAQLLVANDQTPNASAALAQRQNYMVQNGQIVPAVTLDIERTVTTSGRWNTYAVSVTASDAGNHNVTLTIGGHALQVTTPTTVNVDVHQALVSSVKVPIIGTGVGVITRETFIGGSGSGATQVYQDASGNLKIAPTTRTSLLAYYTAQVSPVSVMADIATAIGLLCNDVYGRILPYLSSGATPQIALDADEQNGIAAIQTNINAKTPTSLKTVAPVPAATPTGPQYDLHAASLFRHWELQEKAFSDYAADLQEITTLA